MKVENRRDLFRLFNDVHKKHKIYHCKIDTFIARSDLKKH